MKKILVILILIIGCSQMDAPKNKLFSVAIFPSSGFDTYYSIGRDTKDGLVLGEIELREGEKVAYKDHSVDFVDIIQQFSKENLSKIASNLKEAYHLCESEKIYKVPLRFREGKSVFGDASLVYKNVNISFSPNRKYAIVKSSLGPYFILNLTTLKFENFCVGNGEDVAWSGDTLLAIGYLDSAVKDIQGIRAAADTVLIYDIVEKRKKHHLSYKGKDIEDIEWLENSETLAIALSEKTEHFNPFDILLSMAGHPVEYRNFSVEIFDYRKNIRLKKVIEENVGNGFSFIYKSG